MNGCPGTLGGTEDTEPLTQGWDWPWPSVLAPSQSALESTTGPTCEVRQQCDHREFWRRKAFRDTGKAVGGTSAGRGGALWPQLRGLVPWGGTFWTRRSRWVHSSLSQGKPRVETCTREPSGPLGLGSRRPLL